ncbi:MAG: FHA domain-containing protein [Deltaproteobacteria bacterium]|nr:FHA domain-containing protein [Deltaproteobacteria bacterium]
MGFLQRLLSPDYRRALAAEAEGDYLAAARAYALCGEMGKVSDMHLALARQEATLDGRVRCLRQALSFASEDPPRRIAVRRLLGAALRSRAEEQGGATVAAHELLREAAELFDAGESWIDAGECHESLGDRESAAAAYARAGLVDRVEALLGEQEEQDARRRTAESRFRDHEALWQAGKRLAALRALTECVAAAEEKGESRRLLTELERRVLRSHRVCLGLAERRYWILGRLPLTLGRDADCDLVVRGPSVSRCHVRLDAAAEGFVVEDAGSRNGTTLGGVPIGGRVPLPYGPEIGLGESCAVRASPVEDHPGILRLDVVRGLDAGLVAYVARAPLPLAELDPLLPALELGFVEGCPVVRCAGSVVLRLNGSRVTDRAELARGDLLEVDDRRVDVLEG